MNVARSPVALVARFFRSAVILTYGVMALRLAGFVIVLPLALRTLPPEQVGFWYVLLTWGGLFSVAEVAFSPVISRRASYHHAGVTQIPELGLPAAGAVGAGVDLAGLAGLVQLARQLYARMAVGLGVLLAVTGWAWLAWKHPEVWARAENRWAFGLFVGANIVGGAGQFWTALLYGVNRVHAYQRVFLGGLVANYAVALVGLALGWGIVALVLGQVVLALVPRWLAGRMFRGEFAIAEIVAPRVTRWRDVWPAAWRTGLANFGGFFSLQGTTLVCAQVLGLGATGSFSLSLQLAITLHSVAAAWLFVRTPEIGARLARGEITEARALVARRMVMVLATYAAGAVALWWLAEPLVRGLGSKTLLLDGVTFAVMLFVVGCDLFHGMHNAVLQASNRLPHVWGLVAGGVLTTGFGVVLAERFGALGLVVAPVVAQVLFTYWWTVRACWRVLRVNAGGATAVA